MKWWIKSGILALILAFGAAFGLGLSIPENHTATVAATVHAPIDSVWAAVSSPELFPGWRPDVTDVAVLSDPRSRPRWREVTGGEALTLEVTEWTPPTRMVTRIVDEGLPFGGTWVYELEATPEGTRVTLTENGQIYSAVYRFVAQFFLGYDATLTAYLQALTDRFGGTVESGTGALVGPPGLGGTAVRDGAAP